MLLPLLLISSLSTATQTPHETLKSKFDSAQRMDLKQLPTLNNYEQWVCVGATPESTLSDLVKCAVPVLMEGVHTEGSDGTDNGPVFPPMPPQTKAIEEILFLRDRNPYTPEAVYEDYFEARTKILTSPDLVQTSLWSYGNPDSSFSTIFRTSDGLIFMHQDMRNVPQAAGEPDYAYCYKK